MSGVADATTLRARFDEDMKAIYADINEVSLHACWNGGQGKVWRAGLAQSAVLAAAAGLPDSYRVVPVELPPKVVDEVAKSFYDLDETSRTLVKEEWSLALGMLQLHGASKSTLTAEA